MNPVLRQFLTESAEGLERMTALLLALERDPADPAGLDELFRVIHTFKGNSGLFDFAALTRLVHAGEDLLDAVRAGQRQLDCELVEGLLEMVDLLDSMLDTIEQHDQPAEEQDRAARALAAQLRGDSVAAVAARPDESSDHAAALTALLGELAPPVQAAVSAQLGPADPARVLVRYRPEPDCFYKGEDPLLLLRELPGRLWQRIDQHEPWPALAELDVYRCNLDCLAVSDAPLDQVQTHFRCVAEQVQIAPVPSPSLATLPSDSLRTLLGIVSAQRDALAHSSGPGHLQAVAGALQAVARQLGVEVAEFDGSGPAPLQQLADTLLAQLERTEHSEAAAPVMRSRTESNGETGVRGGLLRVEQTKVDKLMELVGELAVARNALPYLLQKAESGVSGKELAREIKLQHATLNRITEDLQDAVMQIRMLPIGTVLQRFPRLVRDLAGKLDKEVRLELVGEDTEADKTIVEALADPLIHLVRNSLDHGFETPDERRAAGKPSEGRLRISASQQAEGVVIEVADDGRGMDPERIKAKAIRQGLLDPEQAAALTVQQATELVFLPGFSTTETVSDLSGRGVGMDVVKSAVERLRGRVEIHSAQGEGTRLRLAVPLSVAVSHVMLIRSSGQPFGIPMDCVVETVRLPQAQIRGFKGERAAVLRDRLVPLHALSDLLELPEPPQANEDGELAVLLVRLGGETVGLIVDSFDAAADLILKPFEGVLAGLTVYAGTALMGDGSVLMVLNPKELF
ncbi:chemotaxis protein CheA [Chitinimonas lacunae]|uniref:histidine kinase n=1 Tax=Chitinimonas lacunae TaxID=1963018 RepID=A0ABV8MIC1_9NEIS